MAEDKLHAPDATPYLCLKTRPVNDVVRGFSVSKRAVSVLLCGMLT